MSTVDHTKRKKGSLDPGPFRSSSLAPIAWAIAAVLVCVGLLVYWLRPDEGPIRVRDHVASEAPIPPPPLAPPPPAPEATRSAPDGPKDVLGRAWDLKAVFMRYRDSRDPVLRALAGRAHRACLPLFMPPAGQMPSTAHVLNALPLEQRDERRAAVESLFKRCRSFLVQPMDVNEIIATTERVTNGDLSTPGAAARWALIRGQQLDAENIVQRALSSRDAYALQSLSGLSPMLMDENSGDADAAVTDAALALLACDLGAACGADALLAVQLCASEGRCEGTARERMLERFEPIDPAAVQRELARLRILFEKGSVTVKTVWRGGR